ncbi:hypothetical protein CLAFUW4_07610 [Fulvia fulva]|uniref:Lytic polysaccharide monooxygenase n=1 Tax=Passalora fulva TaxID=5499 RepID=A0A9Q8PAZ2_PASFU|nr:uncharacterized protein CLAFUR5_07740 [Fulvia fulva]KAK4622269.1 hypothetical protein CLAFUR4_07616 [Fulvia fulva]KAK4622763.1 hypothetical protein CLAFUR0_07615 [Fulvia fulva]UJO19146.1 hypothetical protein CLAFUR5_07740 [Fulvia fulva]WPV15985.1 hypothetical protein CLAFUW4_07610 [Fulvia fulva]WPV31758.1 hypothetical protein CLAFUW7_07611 [Fulvia fulva]
MPFRFLLAASLALGAQAHMFMSSPVPIEGNAVKPPLDPSGSDFPCHGVQLPATGGQKMAAGSEQLLAFDLGGGANTAVHGGGSCQLAITYETDAAKVKDPKNWKVIYSILGGCPTDAKGNLDQAIACTQAGNTACVNQFPFKIPKGVKDGNAILAWTWFNTIGNREMYMNCANVEFTGGDGSEVDSFPAMFVANLASIDTCPTTEQTNVQFPDPGKYVTTKTEGSPYKLALPTGAGCSGNGGSGSGSGTGSGSAPAISGYGGNGAISSPAPAAPTSAAAPAPSSEAAPTSAPAPAPTLDTAPAPAPTTTPSAPSTSTSSGTCPSGEQSCSTPGEIICIDSTHFGICDIDGCAVSQAVAPGTTCQGGKIAKRHVVKREVASHRRKHGHYHY